jgi:orotate phosphoribosyltransferase
MIADEALCIKEEKVTVVEESVTTGGSVALLHWIRISFS